MAAAHGPTGLGYNTRKARKGSEQSMDLKLKFLGAPQVEFKGTPLKLGVKPLALLAFVALQGETPRRTLAALLWPEADNPLNNLSVARNALAKTLGKSFFNTDPETFALVGDFECDIHLWQQKISTLDPEAWLLWRGPFLSGLRLTDWEMGLGEEFEDWLYHTRETLRTQRQTLALHLARQTLAHEWPSALPYLEIAQGEAGEINEDVTRLLMLVLGALGETHKVTQAYTRLSQQLQEELDVEPTQETKKVLQIAREDAEACKALIQEYVPEAHSKEENRSTTAQTPFVGRKRELALLRPHLKPEPGLLRAVVLQGEPGAGKTRLSQELIHPEAFCVTGVCAAGSLPLAPLDAAIRLLVREQMARVQTLPRDWSDALARFMPDVLTAQGSPLSPDLERRGLFSALRHLMSDPTQPTVFLLDDLQWIDPTTLEFMQHLMAHPPDQGWILIATQRDTEVPRTPLNSFLGTLTRHHAGLIVKLSGLSMEEVTELLDQLNVEADPDTLLHSSGGNPFYLLELIEQRKAGNTGRVQDLIVTRLDMLPESGRQILESLAVLGNGVGLNLLKKVSGRSLEESSEALEILEYMGLVRETQSGIAYGHDIVREVVELTLRTARRSLLNLRAAKAQKDNPLRSAVHYLASHDAWDDEDQEPARQAMVGASDQLALRGDLVSSLEWLDHALEIDHNLRQRIQILLQKSAILERYSRYREALGLMENVRGLLLEISDPLLEAQSLVMRARILQQESQHEEAVSLSERALSSIAHLTTSAGQTIRSEALAILGWSHYIWKKWDAALGFYRECLALRKHLPDRSKMAGTLGSIGLILAATNNEEAEIYLLECLSIRQELGDLTGMGRSLVNLGNFYNRRGDFDHAEDYLQRAMDLQKELENTQEIALIMNNLALIQSAQKKFSEAVSTLSKALELLDSIGEFNLYIILNIIEFCLEISDQEGARKHFNRLEVESKNISLDSETLSDIENLRKQLM